MAEKKECRLRVRQLRQRLHNRVCLFHTLLLGVTVTENWATKSCFESKEPTVLADEPCWQTMEVDADRVWGDNLGLCGLQHRVSCAASGAHSTSRPSTPPEAGGLELHGERFHGARS